MVLAVTPANSLEMKIYGSGRRQWQWLVAALAVSIPLVVLYCTVLPLLVARLFPKFLLPLREEVG
jgi:hypothetical protein